MNNHRYEDEEFQYIMRQKKTMKASTKAREKSLLTFQDGLKDVIPKQKKKQNRQKLRQRFFVTVGSVAAAGIASLIFINYDFVQDGGLLDSGEDEHDGEETFNEMVEDENEKKEDIILEDVEENEALVERILDRPIIDVNVLNTMPMHQIQNETFSIYLPDEWSIEEEEEDYVYSTHMTGPDSERMEFFLFDRDVNQEQIADEIEETLTKVTSTEETTVSPNIYNDEFVMNNQIRTTFDTMFPFDNEMTEMYAFIDEESGRFTELYISELFGQSMIYMMDVPLEDKESWALSWTFFSQMFVTETPYTIQGTESEDHPQFDRPLEKSVILNEGAASFRETDIELYEIDEFGITSYIPVNVEEERIEHEHFIEFRFTDEDFSRNSFYSFGKLKEGFPLENGREIMFHAFNIDQAHHEDLGGGDGYGYGYYDGSGDYDIEGYIQLFEVSDNWYYTHHHSEREDNNGIIYNKWSYMFKELIEWE
ncbi:hypothetical protein [Salipaludibacillus daqingensis]|uniref:hypothetical protein n=1 Tax=Salipaludibacillus daqingensis TaxID=3041001 RepID=UPI0024737CF4|nr:hypothetical protein [Salipaludibacillus daqingensis]